MKTPQQIKKEVEKEKLNVRWKKETWILDKRTIIRVYKMFKREPNKVFTVKEFCGGHTVIFRRKYLGLLITLGLIESVGIYWMAGNNNSSKMKGEGFKLK